MVNTHNEPSRSHCILHGLSLLYGQEASQVHSAALLLCCISTPPVLLQGGPELLLPSEMCLLGLASEWGYL